MTQPDRLEKLLNELEQELRVGDTVQFDGVDPISPEDPLGMPAVQTAERVTIAPYEAGTGQNQDTTYRIGRGTTQVEETTKSRPQCPSCGHIVANPDEPNNLSAKCRVCETQTCPECKLVCESCGVPLCMACMRGDGLEGGGYCPDCFANLKEEMAFERMLDRQQRAIRQVAESNEQAMILLERQADLELRKQAQDWSQENERRIETRNDRAEMWKQFKEYWEEERSDSEFSLDKSDQALKYAKFLVEHRSPEKIDKALDEDRPSTTKKRFTLR